MDMHTPYHTARRVRSTFLYRLVPHAMLVFCIGMLLVVDMRAGVQAQEEFICFEQTGYCMTGRIREFWEQNGGLPVFGYPIGPQHEEIIEEQAFEVQEFERNRLELHPENAQPYDVLLGRLGADRLEQDERDWTEEFPRSSARTGCRFFPETGHNVCGVFLEYWRASGLEIDNQPGKSEVENLALFGLPLSDAQPEMLSDGKQYVVQWFERARFESHPQNAPPYHVLLGLLGNEVRDFKLEHPAGTATPTAQPGVTTTPQPGTTTTPTPTPEAPKIGRIAFASSREGNREIFVMNADGTDVVNVSDHASIEGLPDWSPDATKIVFGSERDGNREIYVMNADGSDQVRLTDNRGDDWNPAWSPDGWRIAFESNRNQNWEVYVMSRDGTRQSNLTSHPANDTDPDWSPDSTKLVFASDRDANREIYVMNADGSGQRNLTNNVSADHQPAWSPDGEKIAFVSDRDGNREIYVMDADGSNPVRLTNHPASDEYPDWSPDGEQIVFRSERDGNQEIYVMNADGTRLKNITENPAVDRDPAWAPDPALNEE